MSQNATSGTPMQMWFDNSTSLMWKVMLAAEMKLGGVGVWDADELDYGSSPEATKQRQEIWNTLR